MAHYSDPEDVEANRRKNKRRRLKNRLVFGLALISLASATYVLVDSIKEKREKNSLYNKVSLKANTNPDNITDAQEWAKVYESFGLDYDIHYSDPKEDLSIKQMRKYLEE
jgi:hypothetical protein